MNLPVVLTASQRLPSFTELSLHKDRPDVMLSDVLVL